MTNDLISFGVWMYVWKFVFYGFFFLVALVLVYPWLLLIPLGIWWLCWKYGSEPEATEDGGVTTAGDATAGDATPGDARPSGLHPANGNPT